MIYGDLITGIILILLGAFFDVFDGLLARLLGVASEFGKQLDSLADMVTFGVAPAALYYMVAPGIEWYYYIPSMAIVLGAMLRLAKFNLIVENYHYFKGMATPASAMVIIGYLLLHYYDHPFLTYLDTPIVYFCQAILLMLLNVSSIKMFSLKSLNKGKLENMFLIGTAVMTLIYILYDHELAPFLIFSTYIILGIAYDFLSRKI